MQNKKYARKKIEQGVAPEKGVAPLELRRIQRKEFRARCRSAGAGASGAPAERRGVEQSVAPLELRKIQGKSLEEGAAPLELKQVGLLRSGKGEEGIVRRRTVL